MDKTSRLKRIRYNCWHRGTKEADLILGGFADQHLGTLSDSELDQLEAILDCNDTDIIDWLQKHQPIPDHLSPQLLDRIFCTATKSRS